MWQKHRWKINATSRSIVEDLYLYFFCIGNQGLIRRHVPRLRTKMGVYSRPILVYFELYNKYRTEFIFYILSHFNLSIKDYLRIYTQLARPLFVSSINMCVCVLSFSCWWTLERRSISYQVTQMHVVQWEYSFFGRHGTKSPVATKCTTYIYRTRVSESGIECQSNQRQ